MQSVAESKSQAAELSDLDPGIAETVHALRRCGVPTYESCQGGPGHTFPEPTVRFSGGREQGVQVLGLALQLRLPVRALKRVWRVVDGEPVGPHWELTFYPPMKRLPGGFRGDSALSNSVHCSHTGKPPSP